MQLPLRGLAGLLDDADIGWAESSRLNEFTSPMREDRIPCLRCGLVGLVGLEESAHTSK